MSWEGLNILHLPPAMGGTQLLVIVAALMALFPL